MFLFKFYFLIFFILMSLILNAHAYLDPGTFSIIINFLIAIVAVVGTYISLFWSKIKKIF